MMDMLNEQLIKEGKDTFAFDHDCREGICGMCCDDDQRRCAHGPVPGTTTCQLHMRRLPRRRHDIAGSSRGAPGPSRWSRTSRSTARSTA
jgi:hypothetical protein